MYENFDTAKCNLNSNVELISIISHELRTPLNIILGAQKLLTMNLSETSNMPDSKDKFIKYLSSIKSNSYRLQRTINNYIDITDFYLGLCKLNLRNNDIIAVIKNIVKHAALIANKKHINLILCTNTAKKIIAFDKEKMERVILNLLSNAIKFSDEGKDINIIVIDKRKSILILIKDQGEGIPDKKLSNIFDIFVQADKSFTRNHEGSGAGLAIVKSFIELHNGNISVKSKEGKGTEFEIELPAKIIPESRKRYLDDEEINIMQKIEVEFSDIYEIANNGSIPSYSREFPPPRISGVF
jgi:signal transduction histidine kinase